MLASRVPVLHEVRDITMARTGDVALVSYENKVCWYNAFDYLYPRLTRSP